MNAIMRDSTLSHDEKAKAMQALQMQGSKWAVKVEDEISPGSKGEPCMASDLSLISPPLLVTTVKVKKETEESIDENLKCAICLTLCER